MAGGPFDYITPAAQQNPFGSAMQGFALGNQVQQQQQQSQLAQQQIQSQFELQRQFQQDVSAYLKNPNSNPAAAAQLRLKYPQFNDAIKGATDSLSDERRKNQVGLLSRMYSAQAGGNTELALRLGEDQLKALENSGANPEEINALKGNLEILRTLPPEEGKNAIGFALSNIADPKQLEAFGKLSAVPGEQIKTAAEVRNLQSQVETRAADTEIKRRETEIKALEARLKGEDNDLKREELRIKIADATDKRDQLKRTQESDASAAFSTVDRVLDTVGRIKSHPGLSGAVGARLGFAAVPGTDAADASALIEQLSSQGFLAEVDKMKGLGALTEAEGRKLTAAIGSLDKNQSEKQFTRNLDDINRQFTDAKKRLETKFGRAAPTEPPVVQSKKYGAVTQKMIDNLAQQKGVSPEVARQFFEAN